MRTENRKMKEFLKGHGIDVIPKYIFTGSIAHTWRLYNHKVKWYGNRNLQQKLTNLGFTDWDDKPFSDVSGNGGVFSIFAKNPGLTKQFVIT